jgi:hypothetical protein
MSDLITKRDPVQIALEIAGGTRGPQGFDDDPFTHLKVLADEVLRLRKAPDFHKVKDLIDCSFCNNIAVCRKYNGGNCHRAYSAMIKLMGLL